LRFIIAYLQRLTLNQLKFLVILLCFPAFLFNLDTIAFIGDEGIRSLVALEMKLSGDFIVPTLNGEPYYNKPPLYNWVIYLVSMMFGYFGEWPARVTTLVFLGFFAWTVYYFVRKQFDQLTALTMALMTLTSGRILFWDSMLGLIDICFSWVIYLNFMCLYVLGKAHRWRVMFILSWTLFSIAFLLKGLPAIVFQGISILVALQLQGVVKRKLFSIDHWLGISIGIIPVLVYYILYATQVKIEHVFAILFDQSMQRTGTHHGLWKTITHIFTFPFEQVYHFLPWSLLSLMFFHPQFRLWIKSNEFIRFNFWMLAANLPVYWLSVQVYPRYLLMFIPLFNMVGYFIMRKDFESSSKLWRGLRYTFVAMAVIVLISFAFMFVSPEARSLPHFTLIWISSTICMALGCFGLWFDEGRTFIWMAVCLLIVRSVFDLVVLPIRASNHAVNEIRDDCKRIGEKYGTDTWHLYKETFPHNVARFYTSAYADQIIRNVPEIMNEKALYLVDQKMYPDFPGEKLDSIQIEGRQYLAVMRPFGQ
jgi:4-amino-4-deoxy-L-arabinose transferase-like glycosyltransferase